MHRNQVAPTAPFVLLVKRWFLAGFLAVTAILLLAVVGLLLVSRSRELGEVVGGALGEGFLLAGAFVGFISFDRPWLRAFSVAGWMISAVMMLAFPLFMWMETTRSFPVGWAVDTVASITGTGFTAAGLLNFAPVVFIPRLNPIGRVVQATSAGALAVAALGIICYAWDAFPRSDALVTVIGSSMAVGVAASLAVFALGKFSLLKAPDPVTSVATMMRLFCPRCGQGQEVAMGESACSACKLKFSIEVEEPRCPKCGYNLNKLEAARCPECGWAVTTLQPA